MRDGRGGVTLTGGEALLQPAFTAAVLRSCKEAGLHTALDTSGFLGARATDGLLADTAWSCSTSSSFDIGTYRKLTGGRLAPTLGFATRLDRLGVPMWIRYVLVPGWTDDPRSMDVLPFHTLGAPKYEAQPSASPSRCATPPFPTRPW